MLAALVFQLVVSCRLYEADPLVRLKHLSQPNAEPYCTRWQEEGHEITPIWADERSSTDQWRIIQRDKAKLLRPKPRPVKHVPQVPASIDWILLKYFSG